MVDGSLITLCLGALLIGLVVGVSGFGDALVGTAVWLHAFSPPETVALVLLSSLFVHAISLRKLRANFAWKRFGPFLLFGFLGVPIGIGLLGWIEPQAIKHAVGGLLVVLGLVFLFGGGARLPSTGWGRRVLERLVAFGGGVLGGFAGLSGVLPTLYLSSSGINKATQRAIYQPFIFAMNALAFVLLWFAVEIGDRVWWRFGI
ncbi:MAG: sulfite exporter TauE/SafE family protein, partial [Pseudomonadota bacterium]